MHEVFYLLDRGRNSMQMHPFCSKMLSLSMVSVFNWCCLNVGIACKGNFYRMTCSALGMNYVLVTGIILARWGFLKI